MKLGSSDILSKIDNTGIAMVTIDPLILNFVFPTLPEIFKKFCFCSLVYYKDRF